MKRHRTVPAAPRRIVRNRRHRVQGSVLITAMVVAVIIAISLTSYIKLALNSMTLSDRSYYQNGAVNLAEIGIEEAVYCYNQLNDVASPADAWTGWVNKAGNAVGSDATDTSAKRTISGFSLGPGVTAVVNVHCDKYNPTVITDKPVIIAKATVTFPNGPPVSKFIQVTLRKRSLFPSGMAVRKTILAKGGSLSIDSWDSKDDGDPSTAMEAYSVTTRRANATLATLSVENDAINVGNGAIYGNILTASDADHPSPTVAKGPNAILTGDFSSTEFDTQRISNDFAVSAFPPIVVPDPEPAKTTHITTSLTPTSSSPTVLPDPAVHQKASDGYYYYRFSSGTAISSNTGILQINDKVVLILENHSAADAINLGGSGGGITIASGAALKVYTNGNVTVTGGGGFSNANTEPSTAVFYGTHPTDGGQSIKLKGNAEISVSLYAPNADIEITGGGSGGDFFGAIVGNSVIMNGNTRFHYDEALSRLFTGNPYGIANWRELQTGDERKAVEADVGI